MAADTFHIIFSIGDEHFRIIRIRPVRRVRQPKVLPDHDTVTVACFIQFLVTDHTDPVTHDRKIHIGMISDSNVVFAGTIVQVGFTESPVSSATDKTTAVDEHAQDMIIFIECHLADTDLEVFRIRHLIVDLEGEISIIQIRFSVTFRPPQTRILHLQLSKILCIEDYRLFLSGRQFYRLLECDIAYLTFQHTFYGIRVMVLHDHFRRQCGRGRVGQRQYGSHERIGYRHFSGSRQEDIVPNTDITSAHRRDPVPANRCVESRIVSTQDTSVEVRALCILFLDGTDMFVFDDLYSHYVLTRNNYIRHIELATHKGTLDTAGLLTVHINVCFPVDTIEVQEDTFLFEVFRHGKLVAIPKVGVEERFRNHRLIVGIVRIGNSPNILVTAQDSTRHGSNDPVFRLEIRSGYLFTGGSHFGSPLQLPVSAGQVDLSLRYGRSGNRLRN